MGKIKTGSIPMPDETMTLREIARRLALIKNPKATGIDVNGLHSLLRSGELRAGFYILEGTVWIDIPISHWEATASNKIRQKITRNGESSPGSYKLRPGQFPDQIASVICEQASPDTGSSEQRPIKLDLALLTSIVTAVSRQYEVTVKDTVYADYLNRHEITEKTRKSTGGRYPVEGWRDLCSYMTAYMMAVDRAFPGQHSNVEATSKRILELAKAHGVENLPKWDTLKAEVSKVRHLLDEPGFKLKK